MKQSRRGAHPTGKRTLKFKSRLEKQVSDSLLKTVSSSRYKYEPTKIPYIEEKQYIPDFLIHPKTLPPFYLEVKGWFRYEDRRKMLAVKETNPDFDIRMFFASDGKLNKNSKMRYSDWCEKHGFKYCIGSIPKGWLR